jgi:hypothetical protein
VTASDIALFVLAGVMAMTGTVLLAAGGYVSGAVLTGAAAVAFVGLYRRLP